MRKVTAVCTLALLLAARVASAVTAAPGYAVRTIPTPLSVAGGVVARGGAVLVGQGSFGAGLESVVRIDGGGTTTIATGFNSLGGFDLDAAGTLYVVDNGGDLGGALTGDTVYAIPNALTRTTPLAAVGAEVLPSGSVPTAQEVLVSGTGLLVADAAGPGVGKILKVVGGVPTNLITGLDYLGGMAFLGRTLLVDDLDGGFSGNVLRYTATGTPLGALATGLPASYGLAVDGTCNALVSGEFSFDCSSGRILAIPPGGGAPVTRATAFCSAGDLYFDGARDETLALDFGASAVTAICRDRNGDSVCDADAPCVGPAALTGVNLKLGRLSTPGGDDTLSLKAEATLPLVPSIDPVTTGLRLRLTGGSGAVAEAMIPGGAYDPATRIGWKPNGAGTQWKYKNTTCPVGAIVAAKVKVIPATGVVRFSVTGKGGAYPVAPADLPLQASLLLDPAGQCGAASLTGCTFSSTGATLSCR
jgi:hypothetical protein